MLKKSWQQLATSIATNILNLYIMPMEQCFFGCICCYDDTHQSKMNPHIVKGIKEFIKLRFLELQQLRINWLGGEPLAASDIVVEISQYVKSLLSESDCRYNFCVTTNGYHLDVKKFLTLLNSGIYSYQITLDGPRNKHEFSLKHREKNALLNRVWVNLNEIKQLYHDFEIILRIQVTPENYPLMNEFIIQIISNFNNDSRFKIFFKISDNLSSTHAGMFSILGNKTKTEIIDRLTKYVGKDMAIYEVAANDQAYICYAASQNAWVIRANGTLAKCTVALKDERNAVGRINSNGKLSLDQNKMQLWLRGLKSKDVMSLSCPAYELPTLKKIPIVVSGQ